jgi:hypothetical protein
MPTGTMFRTSTRLAISASLPPGSMMMHSFFVLEKM